MNKVNLSKSRYTRGWQCPKMLWLDIYKSEVGINTMNEAVLENGNKVGELARKLFGEDINIDFNKDLNCMINDTNKYMNDKPNIITEASFKFENNFCSVDVLKNDIDGLEIYEVKSSTEVKDVYIQDVSYQCYILLNLGYKIKKASIVHINSNYVRNGNLDIHKLFEIVDVTDKMYDMQDFIKNKIKELNDCLSKDIEPNIDLNQGCMEPYPCPFFQYCTKELEKDNIFSIASLSFTKKLDCYKNGIITFKDIIDSNLSDKYKEQADFTYNNLSPKINKNKIKDFMDTLTYPLYFLDFETYQEAIPSFDGIRPFMQIPFQYSLHYIDSMDGELKHKEFLAEAGIDPRRSLAEALVRDIPKDVCSLAYNMAFERTVIKNLAELYPDLSDHLLNIRNNMKDLMVPFHNRDYYVKEMHGSYSIKAVLPSLFPGDPELDYHNLPVVHKGDEASNAYATLSNYSEEEQDTIRKGLLVYCQLDTYAMVKIWEKFKEIIK